VGTLHTPSPEAAQTTRGLSYENPHRLFAGVGTLHTPSPEAAQTTRGLSY
jgi:hypothetical protein